MVDKLESLRPRMTPASFQEFLDAFKRECIRAPPKDIALAQSPVEQPVDTEQVTSPSNFCLISV